MISFLSFPTRTWMHISPRRNLDVLLMIFPRSRLDPVGVQNHLPSFLFSLCTLYRGRICSTLQKKTQLPTGCCGCHCHLASSNPRSRSACRSRKSQLSRSLSIVCDLCVTLLDDDSRARPEMDAICIDAIIEHSNVYHC